MIKHEYPDREVRDQVTPSRIPDVLVQDFVSGRGSKLDGLRL